MTVDIGQIGKVFAQRGPVGAVLEKIGPQIDTAAAKLAAFVQEVGSQVPIERVVQSVDGSFSYQAGVGKAAVTMDMPWADAVGLRSGVTAAIDEAIGSLTTLKGGSFTNAAGGPPSAAVAHATEALSQLDLARASLGESLAVWQSPFGGAHAQLVPDHASAAGKHLEGARSQIDRALEAHVNAAS